MAGKPLRCFVSADISRRVKASLDREIGFLQLAGASVKWVRPRNMHVTLRFIGDVHDTEVLDVIQAVEEACVGIRRCRPLVKGVSTFPENKKNSRVVVAGVEGDVEPLHDLFNALQDCLAEVGFRPERKGLKPHVTLGRIGGPNFRDQLMDRIEDGSDRAFGLTTIDRVQLMMSERSEEGPLHSVMKEVVLE